MSNTSKTTNQLNSKRAAQNSKLAIWSLILAILVPPLGTILGIIAKLKSAPRPTSDNKLLNFSIIWGAIFSLPFILISGFLILIFMTRGNSAQAKVKPLVNQIEQLGTTKLCTNGDNGRGLDNTTPWYEAYYRMPDNPQLTKQIINIAGQNGYALQEDISKITSLKNSSGQDISSAGGYNPKSDYLVAEDSSNSLSITINRQTSVPIYCGVKNYGQSQTTGDSDVILDITSKTTSK